VWFGIYNNSNEHIELKLWLEVRPTRSFHWSGWHDSWCVILFQETLKNNAVSKEEPLAPRSRRKEK